MLKNKILLLLCLSLIIFFLKEEGFSKEKKVQKDEKIKNKIVFILRSNLWIANPDGTEQKQLTQMGDISEPYWAPDGNSIVFVCGKKIWKYDVQAGKAAKFIDLPGYSISPSYSIDGDKIVFTHESNVWNYYSRSNYTEICIANADGSNVRVLLKAGETMKSYPKIFPRGDDIVFNELTPNNISYYLATYNFSSGKIEYLNSETGWLEPTFSPDENFLVAGWYNYEQGGELRMVNLKTLGVKEIISRTPGCQFASPSFSPEGNKIVFEKDLFSHNKKVFVPYGIYVINTDGSASTEIIPDASDPDWLKL
jgi:Tol biopolymer transport system component